MSLDSIDKTLANRGTKYGAFKDHAAITWDLMRVVGKWLEKKQYRQGRHITDSQAEALHMIMHKVGRILNGDPNYIDSWIDIAGYAKLVADELQEDKDFNSTLGAATTDVTSGSGTTVPNSNPSTNCIREVDPNHKAVPRPFYHNDF
jgi:hypothetical protein